MKIISIYIAGLLLLFANHLNATEAFDAYWYDGNAEISVYDLEEVRYSETRKGKRIMVFVTEPLRRTTLIKPDTLLPYEERYNVIKLNDIRKFTTGIYDYSLMTSVFSSVGKYDGIPDMAALKVTFGSQEWCGNVFEIIKRNKKELSGRLFSYFESDGEPAIRIKDAERKVFEDNLWILIRELNGPFMAVNSKRKIEIIPSAWQRRKQHIPLQYGTAIIEKKQTGKIATPAGRFPTYQFVWTIGEKKTAAWVEQDWPHKIVKWVEPDGTRGHLISSSRQPYWRQHSNNDKNLRRKFNVE